MLHCTVLPRQGVAARPSLVAQQIHGVPGGGKLLHLEPVIHKEFLRVRHMPQQGGLQAVAVKSGKRRFTHLPLRSHVGGVPDGMGQRCPLGGILTIVLVVAAHHKPQLPRRIQSRPVSGVPFNVRREIVGSHAKLLRPIVDPARTTPAKPLVAHRPVVPGFIRKLEVDPGEFIRPRRHHTALPVSQKGPWLGSHIVRISGVDRRAEVFHQHQPFILPHLGGDVQPGLHPGGRSRSGAKRILQEQGNRHVGGRLCRLIPVHDQRRIPMKTQRTRHRGLV